MLRMTSIVFLLIQFIIVGGWFVCVYLELYYYFVMTCYPKTCFASLALLLVNDHWWFCLFIITVVVFVYEKTRRFHAY